jgi:uncharacterized protein YggE
MTKKTAKSRKKVTKAETTKEQPLKPEMLSSSSSVSKDLSKTQTTKQLAVLNSADVTSQTEVKPPFKKLLSKLPGNNLRFYFLSFFSGVAIVLLVLQLLGFFYSLPKEPNQLEVKGMAVTEADLDIVEFVFSTKSEGENIDELIKLEQAKQEAIYKFWQTQGVESQTIQTNQSFLAINLPASVAESKPLYNLQTYYRVVFKKPSTTSVIEDIKTKLYQLGINQLEPLVFSSDSLDLVCQDLLIQAQHKAWSKAQQILQQNGFRVLVSKQFTVLRDCESTNFSFFDNRPVVNQFPGWYGTSNQFSSQKQTLQTVVKLVVNYYD